MRNDPIYLSQALTCEASLGVLSVAGDFCRYILAEKLEIVKLWLKCFWDFSAVCCEEERFGSIEDILREKKKGK
jgi:hypothetical protein